jgi:predicted transcriptional regulator
LDEDAVVAAADEGIADTEAGRFVMIAGGVEMQQLWTEHAERLDRVATAGRPEGR